MWRSRQSLAFACIDLEQSKENGWKSWTSELFLLCFRANTIALFLDSVSLPCLPPVLIPESRSGWSGNQLVSTSKGLRSRTLVGHCNTRLLRKVLFSNASCSRGFQKFECLKFFRKAREKSVVSPLRVLLLKESAVYGLSGVQRSATPWTVALQASLSMEFSRQEYWSGFAFSAPGNLSNPGIKPESLVSPALASGFFTPLPPGNPERVSYLVLMTAVNMTLVILVWNCHLIRMFSFPPVIFKCHNFQAVVHSLLEDWGEMCGNLQLISQGLQQLNPFQFQAK